MGPDRAGDSCEAIELRPQFADISGAFLFLCASKLPSRPLGSFRAPFHLRKAACYLLDGSLYPLRGQSRSSPPLDDAPPYPFRAIF
jgi:hypothetical protein